MKNTMKKIPILLVFAAGVLAAGAQSLNPFVVSSSGGFYSTASFQLSFTAGEMTMVETFIKPNNILTQGFQQAFDFGVFVEKHKNVPFAFTVFPNPGDGNFNLAVQSQKKIDAQLAVYDVIGNVILKNEFTLDAGSHKIPLLLSQYSEGMYILEFVSTDHLTGDKQRSLQKIQLIK